MSVIAKLKVARVGTQQWSPDPERKSYEFELNAVVDGSPENKEFFAWTPSAQVILQTRDPAVVDRLKGWGEFYVHFQDAKIDTEADLLCKVEKIGNRCDQSAKRYDVHLVVTDPKGLTSGTLNMGTVNEAAARAFIGFGEFAVRFVPA